MRYPFWVPDATGTWQRVASFSFQSDAESCFEAFGSKHSRCRLIMTSAKDGSLLKMVERG